ncbi:M20/M25/M40 family metallo-hydrolase [Nocardioides solisilvae]|uniref:M20/M25/M40 family metallo-hydrolase n=1 Tax=Nocardioides solisilvae TaxID=1542435 RepID=UPI0023B7FCE1|nr:M20/M25/M40 family metallo-hydrolase [Nocardioides solisilvae]
MNDRSNRRPAQRGRAGAATVALAVAALAGGVLAPPATAGPVADSAALAKAKPGKPGKPSKPTRTVTAPDSRALQKAVTLRGVRSHLRELQKIADQNDGNRASGNPGYRASRDYVVRTLRKAGYRPSVQAFDFDYFEQLAPATLARVEGATTTPFAEGTDFALMDYSGSGDLTAAVQAVDLNLGDLAGSTSGCEAADFAGFTAGSIALIRRGTCAFGDKVVNAQTAGAAGVIIMNTGTEGATDAFAGTLGGAVARIPAVGASFAVGQSLASGATVRLAASTRSEVRKTWNVLAESRQGRRSNVVMAGAHLDSVVEGAGINDNGSGSAALLEVAVQMAKQKTKPRNRVRFAWWGAEEKGLLGAEHYVGDLAENDPDTLDEIALYLNFDMVGSPNYALFVYDGDNSGEFEDGAVGPKGSGAIEALFHDHFKGAGLRSAETSFSGRSDYGPFIDQDIASGGLFTGAEGVKTKAQAKAFGGKAGVAYDECYHAECDDLGNVSKKALDANSDAIAHAVHTYAQSTWSVNRKGPKLRGETRKAAKPHDPRLNDAAGGGGHDHGHALPGN